MKRMISAVVVLGALALATSAISQASQRATRHATTANANMDCGACPIGSGPSCPNGCPLCSSEQGAAAAPTEAANR